MIRIDIKIVCESIAIEREIIERSREIILKMKQIYIDFFSISPCIALPTIVIVIVVAYLQSKRQKLKKRLLAISLKSEKEQQLLLSQ